MADLEVVGYNPATNRLEAPSAGNRYVLQQPLLLQSGVELTGQIVDHITRTAGTGAPGTTDTYTLYADAASTVVLGTFQVVNGAIGPAGQSVDHVSQTGSTGAPGSLDTYTLWGDAAETIPLGIFSVQNALDGAQGPAGPAGKSVLSNVGVPPSNYGTVGDFYIDLSTYILYGPKVSAGWTTQKYLVGPQGPQGPQGAPGSGAGDMIAATYDPAGKASQVEVIANKDIANGYAGLNAQGEVVKPQSGAGAATPSAVKQADGTWAVKQPADAAGTAIASAATVDLTAATGNLVHITGTTAITAWVMNSGQRVKCIADAALPLTYNATTNSLNSGTANVTLAAGDRFEVYSDGTTVRVDIEKVDGTAVVAAAAGKVLQVFKQTDPTNRVFTTTWAIGTTWANFQKRAGSSIMFMSTIPMRNDSASWGGGYTRVEYSIDNGITWASLGDTGYDTVMASGANIIGHWNAAQLIDKADIVAATQVRFRFQHRTYDSTLYIRSKNGITAGVGGYSFGDPQLTLMEIGA